MSDTSLVLIYRVVRKPEDYEYYVSPDFLVDPHLILVNYRSCCDRISQLISWVIDIKSRPIERPQAILNLSTDVGTDMYDISFCPFCGSEIVLEEEM